MLIPVITTPQLPFATFLNLPTEETRAFVRQARIFSKASFAISHGLIQTSVEETDYPKYFEKRAVAWRRDYLALADLLGMRCPTFDEVAAACKYSPDCIVDFQVRIIAIAGALSYLFEDTNLAIAQEAQIRALKRLWRQPALQIHSAVEIYSCDSAGRLAGTLLKSPALRESLSIRMARWNLTAVVSPLPRRIPPSRPADENSPVDTDGCALASIGAILAAGNFDGPDFPFLGFRRRLLRYALLAPRGVARLQAVRYALHGMDGEFADMADRLSRES